MKWEWNAGIRTRIRLSVILLFLATAVTGGCSVYFLLEIRELSERIFERNYVLLGQSQQLQKKTHVFERGILEYSRGLNSSHQAVMELYRGLGSMDSLVVQQKFLTEGTREKSIASLLEADMKKLREDFGGLRFAGSFDTLGTAKLLLEDLEQFSRHNENLTELASRDIQEKYRRSTGGIRKTILYMVVISANFTLVALILLWLLPLYILEPVRQLTERFRRLGSGDFSQRYERKVQDEFARLADGFNDMARRLGEYDRINLEELLREKSRIEAIIQNMNEAVLILDQEEKLAWINRNGELLLGRSGGEIIGRPVTQLRPENVSEERWMESTDSDSLFNFSLEKEGKTRYLHREKLRLRTESGGEAGEVWLFFDITAFRELDLAKTNFMATISHQFKTPISAMIITLNLLKSGRLGPLNSEQDEMLQTFHKQIDRLLNMVNELLEMGRMQSGMIRLNQESLRLEDLIRHSLSTLDTSIRSRSIRIETEIQPELAPLNLDKEKMTWVLNNLLTNALRYSPEGGRLILRLWEEKGGQLIEVQDFGPGIAIHMQQKIFEPWQRAEGDTTRGSGLGLSIAREILKAHTGEIGVRSEPGQGSTFWFRLPAHSS